MDELLEQIKSVAEPILEKNEAFLIDLKFSKIKNARKFIFYIDKDNYVTIEDCSVISRDLEKVLVEEHLLTESDQIEVSSPGVDRPLKFLRQYPKHRNKNFSVTMNIGGVIETREMILLDVQGETLIFDDHGEIKEIEFSNIVKAKTLISFK